MCLPDLRSVREGWEGSHVSPSWRFEDSNDGGGVPFQNRFCPSAPSFRNNRQDDKADHISFLPTTRPFAGGSEFVHQGGLV